MAARGVGLDGAEDFLSPRIDRAMDVVNVNGVATCQSVVDGSDPACVPYNPWAIGGVTSAQLPTYFVGAQEHFDLRKAVEQRDGDKFNLKNYHDTVLSFGSPSGRYVRSLMLNEPIN